MKNKNHLIINSYIAGLILLGFEVKLIKSKNINIKNCNFLIKNNEIYINFNNYKLKRFIKLLLNKYELIEIINYQKKYKLMLGNFIFLKNFIKIKLILYLNKFF